MELKIAAMVLKNLATPLASIFTKHSLRPDVRDCPWGTAATSRHSGLDPESSSFIADIRLTGSPERQGRTLFCHACCDNLAALIAFLTEECCADEYAPPGFYVTTGEKNDC